jgi:hypothetical protein
MSLNKYKKMQILSDSDPEKLLDLIKSQYVAFDIVALYGVNGRHYAWINFDRPMDMRVEKSKRKTLSIDDMNKELNK